MIPFGRNVLALENKSKNRALTGTLKRTAFLRRAWKPLSLGWGLTFLFLSIAISSSTHNTVSKEHRLQGPNGSR